jgi:HlyD family secretion protein
MKRISFRKLLPWLVALAVLSSAVYFIKFRPLPVEVHTVTLGEVRGEVMGTGVLQPRVQTTISPRIQERLIEVLVDQGDTVKAGQLLARLDDGELQRQVDVAQAALASARATEERVRVDEVRAAAVERQARESHERTTKLAGAKITSASDFDKSIEQLRIAESGRELALAATTEAQQQVITAEKTLAHQRERLGFAQILSPYDGLITRRDRDPGGVVVPGSSLLQLISTKEIWISAWVDETASAGLAVGQPALVVFRSEPGKQYPGEVARLGRETDRETREFLVDVGVHELPPNWTVGQRAEAFIETGKKSSALTVPPRFLAWRGEKPGVFAVENGRARWREAKLGLRGREEVEVLEGLSAGTVVCRPRDKKSLLADGQRVAGR